MLSRLLKTLIEFGFSHFRATVAIASSLGLLVCAVWFGWLARGVVPPLTVLIALLPMWAITVFMLRIERRPQRVFARVAVQRVAQRAARVWVASTFAAAFSTGTLAVVTILWFGAQVFLGSLVVEAGTLTPSLTQGGAGGFALDPLFRAFASTGMALTALAIGYGYTVGQRRLLITKLQIPVGNLPPALARLRIVHISDIHIGPYLSTAQLARYVARINALDPDLICITGDIVDHRLRDLDPALPVLSSLRARHGVVAILGNHDHFVGADAVAARIERRTPFTLLRDGRHTIHSGSGALHIVGLEDRGGAVNRAADEEQRLHSLLAATPSNEPVVLLAHRPNTFESAAAAGVALTLSGHTHGGQIALRLGRHRTLSFGNLMSRFCRGLFERHGSYLYVTHGLGVVGQPVRLGVLREIAVVELVAKADAYATAA